MNFPEIIKSIGVDTDGCTQLFVSMRKEEAELAPLKAQALMDCIETKGMRIKSGPHIIESDAGFVITAFCEPKPAAVELWEGAAVELWEGEPDTRRQSLWCDVVANWAHGGMCSVVTDGVIVADALVAEYDKRFANQTDPETL